MVCYQQFWILLSELFFYLAIAAKKRASPLVEIFFDKREGTIYFFVKALHSRPPSSFPTHSTPAHPNLDPLKC